MATPKIDKLSYKELLELQDEISVAIQQRKLQEREEVKQQMIQMAAASGFALDEVLGNKRGARKGSTVAVKYRHPKDATLTWTGRGRQPRWLVAELKKGKKIANFEI